MIFTKNEGSLVPNCRPLLRPVVKIDVRREVERYPVNHDEVVRIRRGAHLKILDEKV